MWALELGPQPLPGHQEDVPPPIDIRRVKKTLWKGNPARDIIIGEICKTNEAKRKAVGKEKEITDKWVEEQLTATHLTNTAVKAMQLKDPKVASPHQMLPTVSSPYKVNSPLFNYTNQLPSHHYVRLLGSGELQKIQHLDADVSPYKMQTDEKRQYLKSSNLLDNEFMAVQINETVIADTYPDFCFNLTHHKDNPSPKAVPDDKHFYRSIALF
jgi:hypothetical protein